MIVTGANNTYAAFGAQLKSDFTGSKSFIPYAVALGSVGALGGIPDFRRFSHFFMALILLSLVLSNKGFFQNFLAGIKATPVAPQAGASTSGTGASLQTLTNSASALITPPAWFNNLLPSFLQSSTTQPGT